MNEDRVTVYAVLTHAEAVELARVIRQHSPSVNAAAWYAVVDELSPQLPSHSDTYSRAATAE